MKNSIVSASTNSGVWGAIQVKAAASYATATSTTTSTPTTSFDYTIPTSNDLYPSVRKRGLAYNDASLTHFFDGFKVSWAYNWYSAPVDSTSHPSDTPSLSQTFVPMLWSDTSDLTSVWAANAQAALDAGADHLLAFNEPDQCSDGFGGSCMGSPAHAAASYKTWMQPFAGRAKLGALAVTNGGSPMGLTYLEYFIGNCTGCTIDFIPIHWYDQWWNVDYLYWYVQQAYQVGGGRPIWITEFAPWGAEEWQQWWFLNQTLPWLDQYDGVERYAYFGTFDGMLINDNGTGLSRLGELYNERRSSY